MSRGAGSSTSPFGGVRFYFAGELAQLRRRSFWAARMARSGSSSQSRQLQRLTRIH